MKRRLFAVIAALALSVSVIGSGSAGPINFGLCAAHEARSFPPGPDHGDWMSLASVNNPSDRDLQCDKDGNYY